MTEEFCTTPFSGDQCCSFPKHTPRPWVPSNLPFNLYWGQSGRYIKLTTHLHLMPKLRMNGSIRPPPHTFIISTGTMSCTTLSCYTHSRVHVVVYVVLKNITYGKAWDFAYPQQQTLFKLFIWHSALWRQTDLCRYRRFGSFCTYLYLWRWTEEFLQKSWTPLHTGRRI
jgi:hypothetical protein